MSEPVPNIVVFGIVFLTMLGGFIAWYWPRKKPTLSRGNDMNFLVALQELRAAFQARDAKAIWVAIKKLGDLFLGNSINVMGSASASDQVEIKKECEEINKACTAFLAEPDNVSTGLFDNRPFLKALAELALKLLPLIIMEPQNGN